MTMTAANSGISMLHYEMVALIAATSHLDRANPEADDTHTQLPAAAPCIGVGAAWGRLPREAGIPQAPTMLRGPALVLALAAGASARAYNCGTFQILKRFVVVATGAEDFVIKPIVPIAF